MIIWKIRFVEGILDIAEIVWISNIGWAISKFINFLSQTGQKNKK
jgi:hypothetical protein